MKLPLATLLAVSCFMSSQRSHAAPQNPPSAPVTVLNTTANPIPIQGSATVSGSVSISGTPTVQVGNAVANPVPVAVQGLHALASKSFNFSINVPSGNRVVFTLNQGLSLSALSVGGHGTTSPSHPEVDLVGGANSGTCEGDLCNAATTKVVFIVNADNENVTFSFSQPIPVTEIDVFCRNTSDPCTGSVSGVGGGL